MSRIVIVLVALLAAVAGAVLVSLAARALGAPWTPTLVGLGAGSSGGRSWAAR